METILQRLASSYGSRRFV